MSIHEALEAVRACRSLSELKAVYRRLVMEFHPDRGGDVRAMQEINVAHDAAFNRLKDRQNEAAKQPGATVRETTETPEEFRAVVDALLKIDGIEIELCGSWLWISGDTYSHRAELKAAGCRWSKSKAKWYWRHAEKGCRWSRGKATMDHIRTKYGSHLIGDDRKAISVA